MFYADEEDWRPITDAYLAFSFAADKRPAKVDSDGSANARSVRVLQERKIPSRRIDAIQIARALSCLRQFGILLPSGFIARATNTLVLMEELEDGIKTTHVDLLIGTVGSGTFWDGHSDLDPVLQRRELEKRYGIFLGCPVMVKTDEVNEALRSEFPWHKESFDVGPEQQAQRSEALNAFEQQRRGPGKPGWGDGLCREMVRKHFAPLIAPGGKYATKQKKWVYGVALDWIRELTDLDIKPGAVKDWVRPLYKELETKANV